MNELDDETALSLEITRLKQELQEAREVLSTLEYSGRTAQDNIDMCPICKSVPSWHEEHREDCALHKALARQ